MYDTHKLRLRMAEKNLNFAEIHRLSGKHKTTVMNFITRGIGKPETVAAILPVLGFTPKQVAVVKQRKRRAA